MDSPVSQDPPLPATESGAWVSPRSFPLIGPIEVRMPGVGPRLVGIGLLVFMVTALLLVRARGAVGESSDDPVPPLSREGEAAVTGPPQPTKTTTVAPSLDQG